MGRASVLVRSGVAQRRFGQTVVRTFVVKRVDTRDAFNDTTFHRLLGGGFQAEELHATLVFNFPAFVSGLSRPWGRLLFGPRVG